MVENFEEDMSPQEEEQEIINAIAKSLLAMIIVDEYPSTENLDAAIGFEFDTSSREILERIRHRVYNRVADLSGGCDLSEFDQLHF